MKLESWLKLATRGLSEAGIASSRLDSLILLEDATGQERAWLLAHPEFELGARQLDTLADRLERRLQHEPLAYIRSHAEFYGRTFEVTPDVLVPRPETEAMIDLLKSLSLKSAKIADIGTGSGALAITAALETDAVVRAVDIDEACLAVAERNAVVHTAAIGLVQGDLLEPFLDPKNDFWPDIVLANLPYVPTGHTINHAAQHEPALALFGGEDGLDLYRQLFMRARQLATAPRHIITEALTKQQDALAAIAADYGYRLATSQGLARLFSAE